MSRLSPDEKGRVAVIHKSLVVGQNKEAVEQIDEYGLYDFWYDYKRYLFELYEEEESRYNYFSSLVIIYHRIKNR